jgi:hypothetical protein
MNRVDNWQENLSDLIRKNRDEPFEFGKFDCTLWAFQAIKASTDIDNAKRYLKGKGYSTAKGALRLLLRVDGVNQPIELMDKLLGERQPIAFARKGDIVSVDASKAGLNVPSSIDVFGPVLGVCYGANSFFVGEFGLIEAPTLTLDAAHHVICS